MATVSAIPTQVVAPTQDATVSVASRQDYQDLDRARHRHLLVIFAASATVLLALALGIATLTQFVTGGGQAVIFGVLLVAAPALSGLSLGLAWRDRLLSAAALLVSALLLAVFVGQLAGTPPSGANSGQAFLFFAAYTLVIFIAGVLADRRFILATAAAAMALSLYASLALTAGQNQLLVLFVLLQEGIAAAVMCGFTAGYRSALTDLDGVRREYERMVRIDNLKEQFITSVNHELRNPVMAMLGYIELLQLPRNQTAGERMKLIVDEANSAGQGLRALINSILETRRMDQGIEDFVPQPVNVRDALTTAIRLIDPREANLIGREVRVRVSPALAILGDPVHLQQILTNLISNAVKYSGPDDPVDVAAARVIDLQYIEGRWGRKTPVEREMVEIMVRDYGLGIPPEDAPLLFQRFARLPRDLASKVLGNGLGLHLCKALAEVMGGTIWLESTGIPGKGTTFYVRLPIATGAAPTLLANEAE
jgi:signal transduction histidine kinase